MCRNGIWILSPLKSWRYYTSVSQNVNSATVDVMREKKKNRGAVRAGVKLK